MNEEIALLAIIPALLTTIISAMLKVVYTVIIAVAIHKDAKHRTSYPYIITLITLFCPIFTSVIYIIYVYLTYRNDQNIVKLQFDKNFKTLMIVGYIIAVASSFFFVFSVLTRGIGILIGLFLNSQY